MLRNRLSWACAIWTACALPGQPPAWRAWQSTHDRNHPLTGRVIDVRERRLISPEALLERLHPARFVLLGEKHDNPDHHRLQAWLIEGLARTGQRRGVAFEMLPLEVADALAAQQVARPKDVDGIATAVEWASRGWPTWELYRPVFAAALAAGFPVFAADLGREELARLRAGGPASESLRRLGLDEPLGAEVLEGLRDDLVRAHCGALPDAALDRLVTIQRARDAQLAAALVSAAQEDGAVLIAGAGHVGHASGAPHYLAKAAPAASAVALALREVGPAERDLEALLTPTPAFDYLWMTPRIEDRDPCERFREELRKLRSGGGQYTRM